MQTECQTRNADPDQTAYRAATIQLLHDTIHIARFMIRYVSRYIFGNEKGIFSSENPQNKQ